MFSLQSSVDKALLRLGKPGGRKRRSDAGRSRLHPAIQRELERLLRTHDRPAIGYLRHELDRRARAIRSRAPSRASIYNFMPRCPPHRYANARLPESARAALYNLGPSGMISGPQLVFYAFQYGDLRAISFASGLPWIDLYLAERMRGWRERDRGLLRAVLHRRGIG